jgi:hypothetical protein
MHRHHEQYHNTWELWIRQQNEFLNTKLNFFFLKAYEYNRGYKKLTSDSDRAFVCPTVDPILIYVYEPLVKQFWLHLDLYNRKTITGLHLAYSYRLVKLNLMTFFGSGKPRSGRHLFISSLMTANKHSGSKVSMNWASFPVMNVYKTLAIFGRTSNDVNDL